MRWVDEGLFLGGKPHGESSLIADIFTRSHGRTLGLVKGALSRKLRPVFQTGNLLKVEWRARLEEQLGVYNAELAQANAADAMDDSLALAALMALSAHLRALPERDPHPTLFEATLVHLAGMRQPNVPQQFVRFELSLLNELGFGLELSSCAATGRKDSLAYVSPKSGRAVSTLAGAPYKDRLLALPPFLRVDVEPDTTVPLEDVLKALALTEHFLSTHLYTHSAVGVWEARKHFLSHLKRFCA